MPSAAARLRDLVLEVSVSSRLLDMLQRATGESCTALLYHSVADGDGNPYFGPAVLRTHLEALAAEFRVLSADEYLWHLRQSNPLPRRSVLLTFDDGYANNATIVQPIMEELGLPWLLYPVTCGLGAAPDVIWFSRLRGICLFTGRSQLELLGRTWELSDRASRLRAYGEMSRTVAAHPWSTAIDAVRKLCDREAQCIPEAYFVRFCELLDAAQLRRLASSDLVEIGCHTATHPFMRTLSDDRLADEVDAPRAMLADLTGRPIRTFAYPAGDYGRRELEYIASRGFDCAFAVTPRLNERPRFEISRVGIYETSVSVLRAKSLGLSSLLRRFGVPTG
jgi:peptidoglycan/xylan/chitin deacetylase (PgdA/CDA1 family)